LPSVANFALPGAGFVADGQGGHAFTYQVDRAQAVHPRTILIVGGLADTGLADPSQIGIGAIDAINKIKVDGQRALVIGPTWYETPVPDAVRRVSEAVRRVAEKAGVPYLDALDPPWLTTTQMRDDLSGPTDEGQSTLADKISAWLKAEVAR
jgi:lysophospholipase L1-like esterase